MKNTQETLGLINCACAVPVTHPADIRGNTQQIIRLIEQARREEVGILLFPELCITGYTVSDLFFQQTLLEDAREALVEIALASEDYEGLIVVGCPLSRGGKIYNCAVVIQDGTICGVVPKIYLPENREYYERRWFASGRDTSGSIDIAGLEIPFGTNLIFPDIENPEIAVGLEVCEDLWAPDPPSTKLALAGATILLNPSASNETIGKAQYRESLVLQQSARLIAAYLYASCGYGESTTDVVYGGDALIAENGLLLARSQRFTMEPQLITAQIDPQLLLHDRRVQASYRDGDAERFFMPVPITVPLAGKLTRDIPASPFVPQNEAMRDERCEEISNIQAMGLASRIRHIGDADMVVGISGGLDSTLALLVAARAADMAGIPREKIHGITMPGFGTTDRTYQNAVNLIKKLGASFHEIPIGPAARMHLQDIGHDESIHNEVYENAQARERTQILMDFSNKVGGIVVGTGDLSELALGWATYNGDHMSMYGVNAGVPKTLVRYLVGWYAKNADPELSALLLDILDTPVSPELLPPVDGEIAQKTEDLVGPYELHDFFLFHFLRNGFTPEKIYEYALRAFDGQYDAATIAKWLETFYRRFFSQQFKRSCLPDGPKVGSVTLSPRGDWRMPSDAVARDYLRRCADIREEAEGK